MPGFSSGPKNRWLRIGEDFINLDNVSKLEFELNKSNAYEGDWKFSVYWNDNCESNEYYLTHSGRKVIEEALGYAN